MRLLLSVISLFLTNHQLKAKLEVCVRKKLGPKELSNYIIRELRKSEFLCVLCSFNISERLLERCHSGLLIFEVLKQAVLSQYLGVVAHVVAGQPLKHC